MTEASPLHRRRRSRAGIWLLLIFALSIALLVPALETERQDFAHLRLENEAAELALAARIHFGLKPWIRELSLETIAVSPGFEFYLSDDFSLVDNLIRMDAFGDIPAFRILVNESGEVFAFDVNGVPFPHPLNGTP